VSGAGPVKGIVRLARFIGDAGAGEERAYRCG